MQFAAETDASRISHLSPSHSQSCTEPRVDGDAIKSNRANFLPNEMSNWASTNDMPSPRSRHPCVAKVTDTTATIFQPAEQSHNLTHGYTYVHMCVKTSLRILSLFPLIFCHSSQSSAKSASHTLSLWVQVEKEAYIKIRSGRQETSSVTRSDDQAHNLSRTKLIISYKKKTHSIARSIKMQ